MEQRSGKGIAKGVIIGALSMLVVVAAAFGVGYGTGHIKVGINGEIYVQEMAIDSGNGIGTKVAAKLNTLESALNSFYFDDVDDEEVAEDIYKAYLSSFGDKYTTYYTAKEYTSIAEASNGEYYGIGVGVYQDDDGIHVSEVYNNTPAKESGIRVDDMIVSVEGESVEGRELNMVVAQIRGSEGSKVKLGIMRKNTDGSDNTIQIEVERRNVEITTVEQDIIDNTDIGYIRVSQFDKVTKSQFMTAYSELREQGIKGLIIDLRGNPGGLLDTVVDMLDELVPDGLIVYTEDKAGKRIEYNGHNSNELDMPCAVLVNGSSASASEVFAGAMQDYEKAAIIGTRTFGKGIVQVVRPLTDGSAVKFTISKYYTPKGQDIHGHGVTPDIIVEESEEFRAQQVYNKTLDNQLQTAIGYIDAKLK